MDIIGLFKSEFLALPKSRDCNDFEAFLDSWFTRFLSEVDNLEGDDWLTVELKSKHTLLQELCYCIKNSVNSYLLGFHHQAYNHLRKVLHQIAGPAGPISKLAPFSSMTHRLQNLYRIRLGSLSDFKRPDLFHIPFEKRHMVMPQRYSMSGLPSLYLGGSSWVCWEELSRPAFESIQISRFQASPTTVVQILDFGWSPAMIANYISNASEFMICGYPQADFALAYAICWPPLASCSIRVMYPNSPFTPEYVIPQLVLQWLQTESDIDGIRYFSTRITQYVDSPEPAANYVFPVRTKKATGYCDTLGRKFLLSRPMAWSLVDQLPIKSTPPADGVPKWPLSLNPDVNVPYWNTHFFECEAKINSLSCGTVTEA
jgi:hypothetical protein